MKGRKLLVEYGLGFSMRIVSELKLVLCVYILRMLYCREAACSFGTREEEYRRPAC